MLLKTEVQPLIYLRTGCVPRKFTHVEFPHMLMQHSRLCTMNLFEANEIITKENITKTSLLSTCYRNYKINAKITLNREKYTAVT